MLSNNRVMIGKDRAGVNFARYSLHQPELVTEEEADAHKKFWNIIAENELGYEESLTSLLFLN